LAGALAVIRFGAGNWAPEDRSPQTRPVADAQDAIVEPTRWLGMSVHEAGFRPQVQEILGCAPFERVS
jgi:hypothetical protein